MASLRICYRLKTTQLDFFTEYCDMMKPLAKADDLLQSESKTSYMGYLLPTLILLQEKLRAVFDIVPVRRLGADK